MNASIRWFAVALLAGIAVAWALPPGTAGEADGPAAPGLEGPASSGPPRRGHDEAWPSAAPTPQMATQQLRYNRRSPVVNAVQQVKGAVVNISSTRLVQVRFGGFDDEMFDRLFGGANDPFSRTVKTTSLGSGVVIHPAGYVLTNAHVVARATEVTCSFGTPSPDASGSKAPAEEQTFSARIISTDPPHDLAVLKIDSPRRLPFLAMGHSDDLMIGETVIAIGNAMGYSHTVTTGVVSALNRQIPLSKELTLDGLIQTDASINPGNSGGPLLNINGDLIGVNTAIRGDAQNIGFAIPIDQARGELAFLLDFARVKELQFGAVLEESPAADRLEGHASSRPPDPTQRVPPSGLRLRLVQDKSPAAVGGLAVGDLVLAVDGTPCGSLMDFNVLMLDKVAGQTCRFQVRRPGPDGGRTLELKIQLLAQPRPDGNALLWAHFGMKARPVDPEFGRQLRLRPGVGLVITQMAGDSQAGQAGLQVGDVLVQVDKLAVNTLDELGQALKEMQPGQIARLGVLRGRFQIYVRLKAK